MSFSGNWNPVPSPCRVRKQPNQTPTRAWHPSLQYRSMRRTAFQGFARVHTHSYRAVPHFRRGTGSTRGAIDITTGLQVADRYHTGHYIGARWYKDKLVA